MDNNILKISYWTKIIGKKMLLRDIHLLVLLIQIYTIYIKSITFFLLNSLIKLITCKYLS